MNLFNSGGAHVLVDGQFGSTGKGLLASWLAEMAIENGVQFRAAITNAGPNSGHTFYHDGEKHVLKQLPTFAVASYLRGSTIPAILSAGAVINPEILAAEAARYPGLPVFVHPNAAMITEDDINMERSGSIAAVASTGSGTGAAIARKVLRDPSAIWLNSAGRSAMPDNVQTTSRWEYHSIYPGPVFVEASQGFSLGINQQFYPKGTSRECTVQQAISDAGIPARHVSRVYLSLRTWPIRVGDHEGNSSGGWYADQRETDWGSLGVAPELTTVTKRVRRVASFSRSQFREAAAVNDPDWVFVNFLNYPPQLVDPIECIRRFRRFESRRRFGIIGGYGPLNTDVKIIDYGTTPVGG